MVSEYPVLIDCSDKNKTDTLVHLLLLVDDVYLLLGGCLALIFNISYGGFDRVLGQNGAMELYRWKGQFL